MGGKRTTATALLTLSGLIWTSVLTGRDGNGGGAPAVPRSKIDLWNGKDLSGWTIFIDPSGQDPARTWYVKDGVIRCEGRPYGYLRTTTEYADYLLHVEWRWPGKPGNSGVFVHMSGSDKTLPKAFECQLQAGEAGYMWMLGPGVTCREHAAQGVRSSNLGKPVWYKNGLAPLAKSSEKPPGEWNVYQILCKDDWIVLLVNGALQNVATRTSLTSGRICLQSEGAPIEFRNLYLEPVDIQ